MAHQQQKDFCRKIKNELPHFFKNKRVLDIGSLDVNGNNKELFENCDYIGLDIANGNNVDVVSVGHLYDAPDESFDVIISTEVFEHDMFYEKTITNIIRMLKKEGLFIFTCASTGRPEHGTKRCNQDSAPLLEGVSEEWANYYKNLEESDVKKIEGFREAFQDGKFEYGNYINDIPNDLYFYGIKGGDDKLKCHEIITPKYNNFEDHIFVVDAWTDTFSKKQSLVNLIKRLKVYNIPILLVTHYPVETKIQNLVDYYIFDKQNEILEHTEYENYAVASGHWVANSEFKLDSLKKFHHDYAVWKSLKNAFNFCKYLKKKYIHFLEYDNLPEEYQYRQCFLERINNYDAILYEYNKAETEFCATFIFSIKTDIAVQVFDLINSKEEYFLNRPQGWQLEKMFIKHLRIFTSNILFSDYVDNDFQLNKHAVWNRDGIVKENDFITIYDGCSSDEELFLVLISGFSTKEARNDALIEINYGQLKMFHELSKGEISFINLGKYTKGKTIRCFMNGIKVHENLLIKSSANFREFDKIEYLNEKENKINISWIDGPKVEVLGKKEITYNVKFIDDETNKCLFETDIKNNNWAQCYIKYYVDWRIEVRYGDKVEIYKLNLSNKNVLIDFQSSSLGDTIAWIEAVNQFQIKHDCNVICKVFIKNLFENEYKNIKFIYEGDTHESVDVRYELGIFYNEKNEICRLKHKTNPLLNSLVKTADDILGVNTENIKPKISKNKIQNKAKKTVCIATHSTSQCKYWNNESGWNKVVKYLNDLNYEVICLDKYNTFGISQSMNKIPENCIDKTGDFQLKDRIRDVLNCDFFIGLSSGLSWLAWACDKPIIMISGFTDVWNEFYTPYRVHNKQVCNSCWNDVKYKFDPSNWMWCPRNKNFECSREITFEMVKEKIDQCISDLKKSA